MVLVVGVEGLSGRTKKKGDRKAEKHVKTRRRGFFTFLSFLFAKTNAEGAASQPALDIYFTHLILRDGK